MERTRNSIRNIAFGFVGQGLQILAQFAGRTIFIQTLSVTYLGLNGLFINILGILSLAELGFASALIFSMYQPVALNNQDEIRRLMNLYRRIYRIVAGIILCAGLCLLPFLNVFVKETSVSIDGLRLIFLLYLANTVVSYTLIYKKSIIEAHQKNYINTYYKNGIAIGQNILQIVFLLVTKNFYIYLIIMILCTVTTNLLISKKANRMYSYLREDTKSLPDKKTRKMIYRNTYAMSLHKVGEVVLSSTDNIILSVFVSLSSVAIYSNYTLLMGAVTNFLFLIFNAFTASIGNLGVTRNEDEVYDVFKILNFLGFWIFSFCSVAFLCLYNPFIKLWIGNGYLFTMKTVLIIVLNFYLIGMRQATLKFREAMGIFWYDRYKPIVEALLNLALSVFLALKIGIAGVFIGTAVSMAATSCWVEPYVLYKYGFHKKYSEFLIIYSKYSCSCLIAGGFTYWVTTLISGDGVTAFIIKLLCTLIIYNLLFIAIYHRNAEFKKGISRIYGVCRIKSNPLKNP